MKASLKFREDQKPLLRAKIPINILGFPFQSGVAAGESKELSLQLATFFDSGPSLKFAYRPNDAWNPFSFVVKTGIGAFGSPNSSSMMMSAEFNLVGQGNPSFFLHFKPKFGDFSIKKSQSSNFVNNTIGSKLNGGGGGVVAVDDGSIEVVERPVVNDEYLPKSGVFLGEKMALMQPESTAAGVINGFCSGAKMSATTSFPVRDKAVVKFRWGVRFPAELRDALKDEGLGKKRMAGISFQKIPLLVMDKISIEHVDGTDSKGSNKVGQVTNSPGNTDVADMCFSVKRQLEFLHAENGLLRKAVEDLRSDFSGGRSLMPARATEVAGKNKHSAGKKGEKKSSSEYNGFAGKGNEGDVNEELKKFVQTKLLERRKRRDNEEAITRELPKN